MSDGYGFGARRRYLAEQAEFMRDKLDYDVISKKALKATEFEQGNAHEAYSGEAKRRRVAAAGMGWGAASAATGMAGSAALAANTLSRPAAQAGLTAAQRKYPVARKEIGTLKEIGVRAKKYPKSLLAGAAGLGTASVLTGRVARFRNDEETGISQGLGRIKAGSQYTKDQQRIGKSLVSKVGELKMYGIAGQLAQDPQVQRAALWAQKNRKPLGIAGGTAVGGTLAYQGVNRSRKRRLELVKTREELSKREFNDDQIKGHRKNVAGQATQAVGALGTIPGIIRVSDKKAGGKRIIAGGLAAYGGGHLLAERGRKQARKGAAQARKEAKAVAKRERFSDVSGAGMGATVAYTGVKISQDLADNNLKRAGVTPPKPGLSGVHMGRAGQIGGAAAGAAGGLLLARNYNRRKQVGVAKKYEPLRTSISEKDAERLERRYGLKGPLPKGLTREQKMAAYEARYVRGGGKKAEQWQARAERSEKIRAAGVGAGVAAGAAYLGSKAGAGRLVAPIVRRTPLKRVNRKGLETAGVAVGTATGAAEIDAMRARRKRSSYASAPSGVAASALRRMQAYTPEERR